MRPKYPPPGTPPDMFARLSANERAEVMALARPRVFERGEIVFAQGNQHSAVFVVDSGIVRTFYTSPDGRELTLAFWRRGNLVGTPVVLGGGRHQWSGEAAARSELLELRGPDLRRLVERIPAMAIGLIEALEFKGQSFSAIVQMLGTMNVAQRIVAVLRSLAVTHGVRKDDGVVLSEPFTHDALAQMVGASRQSITVELNRLQEQGVLKLGRQSIIILQPDLLTGGPADDQRAA